MTQRTLPSLYDKALSPNQACGRADPMTVQAQFHAVFLEKIDTLAGQVTLGGYLRQWWQDPRLAYNTTAQGGCFDMISMPPDWNPDSTIWTPNLYIDNLVQISYAGSQLVQISPDGSIWWSRFLNLVVKAKMNFAMLPFDSHMIRIVVASYSMDNTIVRVVAKAGTPGPGESGTAMTSEPITSSTWAIQDEEASSDTGMATAGLVELRFSGSWDYLHMSFKISRRPKFFIEQVLIQDFLFLGVSYAGFYVSPNVAPARAAMAVIPVLIMRTLANAVFSGLPQLSYSMWLADYLQVSMWLCVLCVCQFAITQFCLLKEARFQTYFTKLLKTEDDMRKIIDAARVRDIFTTDLLDPTHDQGLKFRERPDGLRVNWNYSDADDAAEYKEGERPPMKHSVARADDTLTEAMIGVLENAATHFKLFDKDKSGFLSPGEIRRMLVRFNVYMTTGDCADAMCKFVRDRGQASPKDPMQAMLRLGEFIEFLYDIDDYLIAVPQRFSHPWSQALPASRRWDIAAQWFFPLIVFVKIMLFIACLGAYKSDDLASIS